MKFSYEITYITNIITIHKSKTKLFTKRIMKGASRRLESERR